ncbi:MAG: molybdenum cofactor biosynthesis protein MoaE, partial [Magnetococcales bacterium]|nr:molybdenum cofactor biosynthesis protein MoaE [Magnetococcales bacterium]
MPSFRRSAAVRGGWIMIRVQREDFSIEAEMRALTSGHPGVGAVVAMIGTVRDLAAEDTQITALELEHYPGMTEKELEQIVEVARARYPIEGVTVVHRVGRLALGENIVLVLVAAAHRAAAFDACRFLIDYLKVRATFWKKEITDHGERWVDSCPGCEAAVQARYAATEERKGSCQHRRRHRHGHEHPRAASHEHEHDCRDGRGHEHHLLGLGHDHAHPHDHGHGHGHGHDHAHPHDHGHDHAHPHPHDHGHNDHAHPHPHDHGYGHAHPHDHGYDHAHPHDHGHDNHAHPRPHDHGHTHDLHSDHHTPGAWQVTPPDWSDLRVGVLTLSDSRILSNDGSGDALEGLVRAAGGMVVVRSLLPDDRGVIGDTLRRWADERHLDVILTTGGTGPGPRDVTPEATRDVCDRELPGIPELMRQAGMAQVRSAALTRGVAAMRGTTLILNLPGSQRGATHSLQAVADLVP